MTTPCRGIGRCTDLRQLERHVEKHAYMAIKYAALAIYLRLVVVVDTQSKHYLILFGFLRALDLLSNTLSSIEVEATNL